MGALEPWHLIVILFIALLVLGPGKVGELGGTLGHSARDFRDALDGKEPRPAATPQRTCTNCRTAIPDDAKFCPGCGLDAKSVTLDPAP